MINTSRRIICFILFALSFFIFSSCALVDVGETEPDDGVIPDGGGDGAEDDYSDIFILSRYTGERLDPYASLSRVNRDLLSLCYDPLVHVDSHGDAYGVIASSFEIAEDYVVFTIDPNARFSDGTSVTAADCAYSFELASAKTSVYADRFEYISHYEILAPDTFKVYFSTPSIYNVNLCDFLVVKKGTMNGYVPVGSGKYVIVRENSTVVLNKNPYASVSADSPFEVDSIMVHNIQSTEELLYNFNYNKIHGAYTDITDSGSDFRGNIETISFCDNSMVFAVVNEANSDFLADPVFVKGLSYCIDRNTICHEILSGGTDPVWYPFNPDWSVTEEAQLNRDIYSTVTAHELFTEAGVILTGTERTYLEEKVELKIIVNSENLRKVEVAEYVANDLESMGFAVTVQSLTWDKFTTALEKGDYDIYIAETLLPWNMDVSGLLEMPINYGTVWVSDSLKAAVSDFNVGAISMREFLSVFQNELPVIPLYFNRGALAINRIVSGDFEPSDGNLYNGIENWVFSNGAS